MVMRKLLDAYAQVTSRLCAVRERTADDVVVGRCWMPLTENRCPRHGDVSAVQRRFVETGRLTDEHELEANAAKTER